MDSQILVLAIVLLALLGGAGLGWFFGSRPVVDLRDRLAARDGEVRDLDKQLLAVIEERSTLRANAEHFEAQKRLLLEAQEGLKKSSRTPVPKCLNVRRRCSCNARRSG